MAKLGFFDILKVFACTIRRGRLCFDWYLKASKAGNDRVTSLQQINKKLLETIGTKKAAGTHFAGRRPSWTGRSRLAFMPFGFWFWGITLPSFWGHSCHLAFDFWAFICLLFHLECNSWLVKFWFGLLVWFECTDIWYKLLELICELLTLRLHTSSGNPLGKFFKWLVNL